MSMRVFRLVFITIQNFEHLHGSVRQWRTEIQIIQFHRKKTGSDAGYMKGQKCQRVSGLTNYMVIANNCLTE